MTPLTTATTEPITRVQIARYAGAVGDFNPIHLDDAFAPDPNILAMSACVMISVLVGRRSRLISSQRQSCWPTMW